MFGKGISLVSTAMIIPRTKFIYNWEWNIEWILCLYYRLICTALNSMWRCSWTVTSVNGKEIKYHGLPATRWFKRKWAREIIISWGELANMRGFRKIILDSTYATHLTHSYHKFHQNFKILQVLKCIRSIRKNW